MKHLIVTWKQEETLQRKKFFEKAKKEGGSIQEFHKYLLIGFYSQTSQTISQTNSQGCDMHIQISLEDTLLFVIHF